MSPDSWFVGLVTKACHWPRQGTEEKERVCMGKVVSFGVAGGHPVETVGRHCTWESRAQEEGWGKGTDFQVIRT